MKKITAIILSLLLCMTALCACGDAGDGSTRLFNYKDLSKYIEVAEYKGLPLSSENEEFKKIIWQLQDDDMSAAGYGDKVEVASGNVEDGDTVHITYVGTMDGEEFSGGSSGDAGTDLVIGSGSFIDGFESGLIGAAVGSTVVLDLKFPNPYPNSPDLAGKPVQFTVEVQSITRTEYPELTDEIAVKLGYDNLSVYNAAVFAESAKQYLFRSVVEKSKVLKVPETELNFFVDTEIKNYTNYAVSMGASFEDFLKSYSMTEEEFREQLTANYKTSMTQFLVVYYIARAEGITITDEDINKEYAQVAADNSVDEAEVRKHTSEEVVEFQLLYEKVRELLFGSAKIEK